MHSNEFKRGVTEAGYAIGVIKELKVTEGGMRTFVLGSSNLHEQNLSLIHI